MQQSLQGEPPEAKPFSGGSPAIAIAPTRNAPAGPRHAPQESAQPVQLERPDRLRTPAPRKSSAWKTPRLSAGPHRARMPPTIGALRLQEQAGAEPEHDDPHVLDRMQREQPLEVVLEEGDDAADGRQRADAEHEHAEPRRQDPDPLQ